MLEEKKKKIEILKKGKIDIYDIDRDEDIRWLVADLWCTEKHLSLSLGYIVKKLKDNPDSEYYKKLYELLSELLTLTRVERAKHLKRIVKIHEFGVWCPMKHFLGIMMQASETGAKSLHMGEDAKDDFQTSIFAHDAFMLLNAFSRKYKKPEKKKE